MGIPVLILGESGSGKSTSIRNFDPGEVGIFNVASKPLPFRKKIPTLNAATYQQILASLANHKLKRYVIDDSQYLICFEFFAHAKEKGYDKFTDMALNFYNLIQFVIHRTPPDVIVYFLHHVENTADGRLRAKTAGKMLDEKLIVERTGKNSALKVIDPEGRKGGQQLLNEFVEQFALDLPAFMEMPSKKKADVLLRIIGIGEQLYRMEQNEQQLYNRRTEIGRIADQKAKFAAELPLYADVPKEPVSAAELIAKQQEILARNGQRQQWQGEMQTISLNVAKIKADITKAEQTLAYLRTQLEEWQEKEAAASKSPEELEMESTAELEEQLHKVEEINAKVRANCDREKAEIDADDFKKQYEELTTELEQARAARHDLLNGAQMPLPGLSVENGELIYNGQAWDNMSGADQMIVGASIVRKLTPSCGFVLLDKLEQMDLQTLTAFNKWLESEGLQAIATRVSTGDECSIIIEDGHTVAPKTDKTKATEPKTWKAGEF